MSLLYDQKILDLGEHGILGLTLSSTSHPPFSAQEYGFAHWYDENASPTDRLDVCTRVVSSATLLDAINDQKLRLSNAVASVTGRLDWLSKNVSDNHLEAPSNAFALDNGQVLLAFYASKPFVFRLTDVINAKIIWEETLDELRKRLKVIVPSYMPSFIMDAPVIYAAGSKHILIYLGDKPYLLRVDNKGMELVDTPLLKQWAVMYFAIARTSLLAYSTETGDVRIDQFNQFESATVFDSQLKKKSMSSLATGQDADRFVLSHPGGNIEIVNCQAIQEMVLRPIPRSSSKDYLGTSLSRSGRYLVVMDWTDARVVDLEKMQMARVSVPDCSYTNERHQFSSTMTYRTDWACTDSGGYVLENKVLTHTAFDALHWEPMLPVDAVKHFTKSTAKSNLDKHQIEWRKPAVRLVPSERENSLGSKLYGMLHLPSGIEWPKFENRLMLLLCQIDLTELAAKAPISKLPQRGALLFFVAVDEDGEPILDDSFNPKAVHVMLLQELARYPSAQDEAPNVPEQAIKFEQSHSDMPQTDAVIVLAAKLSDDDFERYRILLEGTLPDGAEAGHRMGGYPHLLQSNDIEAQAHFQSTGKYPANGATGAALAAEWQLLLQLDSDDVFMWGTDSGILYFMINEHDLALDDFSGVIALSEGC